MQQGFPFTGSADRHSNISVYHVSLARCTNCQDLTVWIGDRMAYPRQDGTAPLPNPDLPVDVKSDYEEASSILELSPRGAAALLRLAIQNLCVHLGGRGKNLNDDIKQLVEKGLPALVQKALDIVRVTGNHAVHPGKLDIKDKKKTAENLFGLVNVISESMITQPKHANELYGNLPGRDRAAINNWDSQEGKDDGK